MVDTVIEEPAPSGVRHTVSTMAGEVTTFYETAEEKLLGPDRQGLLFDVFLLVILTAIVASAAWPLPLVGLVSALILGLRLGARRSQR